MTAATQIGRLTVYPSRSGLGQDVVARHRAEAMLAALDLPPLDPLDRTVLVLRGMRWAADRGLPVTARTEVAQLARAAARPVQAPSTEADAVLFADEVELLRCLTLDALSGHLSRWYWRRVAPARSGRIGAVLTAAWTQRARWLPAALTGLPVSDAIRAVAMLSPDEVRLVRLALFAAFDIPVTRETLAPPMGTPPMETTGTGRADKTDDRPPTDSGETTLPLRDGMPDTGTSPPSTPQALKSSGLDVEHRQLLLLALGLCHQPGTVRRTSDASLDTALDDIAPATVAAFDGITVETAVPPSRPVRAAPARVEPQNPRAEEHGGRSLQPRAAQAPSTPAYDPYAGVRSRYASALYLINLAAWLQSLHSWASVELLARHVFASVAPGWTDSTLDDWDRDPLWALLGDLDGREPDTAPVDPDWSPLVGALAASALAERAIPIKALMQPGRLHVTATHVDVVLNLQNVDLHARIAGLDRDPGWVPDLARIIAFHFEDRTIR